jgi:hypothetical protein
MPVRDAKSRAKPSKPVTRTVTQVPEHAQFSADRFKVTKEMICDQAYRKLKEAIAMADPARWTYSAAEMQEIARAVGRRDSASAGEACARHVYNARLAAQRQLAAASHTGKANLARNARQSGDKRSASTS